MAFFFKKIIIHITLIVDMKFTLINMYVVNIEMSKFPIYSRNHIQKKQLLTKTILFQNVRFKFLGNSAKQVPRIKYQSKRSPRSARRSASNDLFLHTEISYFYWVSHKRRPIAKILYYFTLISFPYHHWVDQNIFDF